MERKNEMGGAAAKQRQLSEMKGCRISAMILTMD